MSDAGAAAAGAGQTAEALRVREQYRDAFDRMQQEQEAMRQAAEEAGGIAEAMRVASLAPMAATGQSLGTNLAPMRFLSDSKDTMRRLTRPSGGAGRGVASVLRRDASRN
jgi:hypothetical protein